MRPYTLSDFDFHLPEYLIAQQALTNRSASRLMIVQVDQHHPQKNNGQKELQDILKQKLANHTKPSLLDSTFNQLIKYLEPGDLLIYNNTEVLKARLYGKKITGAQVEILIERIQGKYVAISKIRANKAPKPGTRILLTEDLEIYIEKREGEFYKIRFNHPCLETLNQCGQIPLPPYIQHQADTYDEKRYQTTFASVPGAIAAPTAGLHFDDSLLSAIHLHGVELHPLTLHVGAGTFSPIRCEIIKQHQMHPELYTIPTSTINAIQNAKRNRKKIIAIGTTTLRALESAALKGQFNEETPKINNHWEETNLFITPGFEFQIVDKLITNFHLPKSSLLILVSSFAGYEIVQQAYQHAIEKRYRFFSYGDAMLLSYRGGIEPKI